MKMHSEFNPENLPYIFQSEFYSIAWGKQHYGFYIDPEGHKYVYNEPEKWKPYTVQPYEEHPPLKRVWGHETEGEIKPEDLFHNLRNAEKRSGFMSIFRRLRLTPAMLTDLLKSKVSRKNGLVHDAGIKSKALLIYTPELNVYRRILLSATGDMEMLNTSKLTKRIIRSIR